MIRPLDITSLGDLDPVRAALLTDPALLEWSLATWARLPELYCQLDPDTAPAPEDYPALVLDLLDLVREPDGRQSARYLLSALVAEAGWEERRVPVTVSGRTLHRVDRVPRGPALALTLYALAEAAVLGALARVLPGLEYERSAELRDVSGQRLVCAGILTVTVEPSSRHR